MVIADLSTAAAEDAAAEIERAGGVAMGVKIDVTSEAEVERAVAVAVDAYGGVDVLVSNAGIQIVHTLDEFPFADWKRMLAVHLDGAFLTTRACLKAMYAAGGGSIIYIGSAHSKEASVLKAPYVTAKHGLIGLPRWWRRKAPSTGCGPTSLARVSSARRWSRSRFPSRPPSSESARPK